MVTIRLSRGPASELPRSTHLGKSIKPAGNLWLAEELWKLDAIGFGDFTLGRTAVHSPIYVNLRRLISNPRALGSARASSRKSSKR